MLDVGVFFWFLVLRHLLGQTSEEHQAAEAMAKVLEHQGNANAQELKAAAAAASTAPQLPAASTAPVVPQAVSPTGAPIALPSAVVTPKGTASSAASPAPFPAVPPPSLPAFPAGWAGGQPPGWVYAEPVSSAVAARAQALLPQLWATGAGTHTQEMTGGQWTVYNAENMGHGKGVTAYRPKAAA